MDLMLTYRHVSQLDPPVYMLPRHEQIRENTKQIKERELKEVILPVEILTASLTNVDGMIYELPEDNVYQDEYKSVL